MQEESGKVTPDKLYIVAAEEASQQFTYGSLIKKDWLIDKFSIEFPEFGRKKDFDDANFEFLQNMEGFKNIMLEDYQMHLKVVRGEGYLIVQPKEQSDIAMESLKDSVANDIRKAVKILTHINEAFLNQDDIRKRDEQQGKIAAISAFTRKRIKF
jgi:hypothetical protein